MGKAIKSMSLAEAKTYLSELKSQGKTPSTSKEAGKVENYIKTLTPDAEERYGTEDLGRAYEQLSRGVTEYGGWTEKNIENIKAYTGEYPLLVTQNQNIKGSEDLTGMLNSYQDGVFSVAGQPQLRQTIAQQLEPEMAKPEPINRVEEFQQMREEMGVQALETTLNDLKAQLEEQYAAKRTRTQSAEGKPVELGVIAGRVSEIERQENERIDAIGRQINVINDQLNTAYNTISTMIQYMGLDYQDAYQMYNDEYNKNLQIYKLVDEELDEQEASARANLQTYTNAILNGNLSYESLSADQKLQINKLELMSGLPVGFVSSLGLSPKDKLLSVNDKTGEALFMDSNGSFQVVKTGMTPSGTGGSDSYSLSEKAEMMDQQLQGKVGADGKVSPNTWLQGIQGWTAKGGTISDFADRFGTYVNKSYSGWYNDYEGFSIKDSNDYY